MVIVSRKAIHEYALIKSQATEALNEWYLKTKAADCSNLADVKNTFNSVDYVGNDNYVFNIKGNQYRLIARIIFPVRTVFIRFIGTHAEYDKIDASSA
ncbi:type II toxin-antitoxin system HigB family toxin [Spirosoma sp. HMF3257]|uniref:Type II toxin-antitoxin system HigB family toxin n=1 Tax=Spirosoma telluris TaxID=2183553 RepID=A0A327NFU9_9BACT|nr:type II toxin-antitoxin system HigB family toxin [Spirosoma telluris]RAI74211.1 type II toxin-antitoxin system HigB family toxin [Spirosoma telluris]